MLTEEAELLSAAEAVARTHPRAARLLRAAATPVETPDPRHLRKTTLRRAWRLHLPGMSRSAAARELAARWAGLAPEQDPLPGTLDDLLARLDRSGVGRVSARTITDDLDPDLD